MTFYFGLRALQSDIYHVWPTQQIVARTFCFRQAHTRGSRQVTPRDRRPIFPCYILLIDGVGIAQI